MAKPLVNNKYTLQRAPGKGGWTFIILPELKPQKSNPFGMFRVRGSIDHIGLKGCHLMPMGNGQLFLPVNAGLRKQLGKQVGAEVQLILYPDTEPTPVPEELIAGLSAEPEAWRIFQTYTDGNRKAFIDWIYAAKTEQTRTNRMVQTITKLLQHKKLSDP